MARLNERGARVARFDPGVEFPTDAELSTWFGKFPPRGVLATRSREVVLERVRSVHYRRPTPYLRESSSRIERFTATQARFGVGGILASLPCQYVSHPWAITAAEAPAGARPRRPEHWRTPQKSAYWPPPRRPE
ncbi:MvdC/MvdD family ATP grasp protein [Streptosporangium sp. NPDC000095]|uniref:MvdC/MvdD family ATP grasp protein n=1 Tax=Streptosporangium sp. NPDC000095 TaxID=3366184 RepID=UPI0036821583